MNSPSRPLGLTRLERAAAPLLLEGLAVPQMAPRIGCGRGTISFVVGELYRKLGAQTRAEAVAAVIRHGLTEPDPDDVSPIPLSWFGGSDAGASAIGHPEPSADNEN